ncbi:MAG: glucosyl-3-phosphoglycerate synthase, partial [Candidatus Methanofastidiosia archaeon]
NTFHYSHFEDIEQLLYLKEKGDKKITVCLPTENSEKTIGHIIRVIKDELIKKFSLVDEIVVVDAHSTDRTRLIVEGLDVNFFYDNQILSGLPRHFKGKGESIWKSLAVSTGDIIVWMNTDILNFAHHFVYGLVGPLLLYDTLHLVKGFYRHPSQDNTTSYEKESDPVTEILTRPFLNLFYPELTGIVHPLLGKCAGRREILESVPFFTGYGMELGLLIDIYRKWGEMVIAQVDLGWRFRQNMPQEVLSKISFGILQVMFNRLHDDGKIELIGELSEQYHKFISRGEGFSLQTDIIKEWKRPPMKDIIRVKQGINVE